MMSLLSSILSFAMGGLPKVLTFFQSRQDSKHEQEMAKLQNERDLALAEKGFASQQKVEEIRVDQVQMQTQAEERVAMYQHDMKIGEGASTWVVNLRASVRPVVTYIFVAELVTVNFAGFWYAWMTNVPFNEMIAKIFSDDEMTILSSIIAFWFGTQAFSKK